MSSNSKQLGLAEIFVLSGGAAIFSRTATAPIDRVKLLLQNQGEIIKAGYLTEPYKGIVDCTVRTFKNEGFLPFWRGNLANCVAIFPTQAFNFVLKDWVKGIFKPSKQDSHALKISKNIISGGAAGALSLSFVYSLDYARTRLANDIKSGKKSGERQFNGLIDVYTKTLKTDGFVGLYRGFVISCVGIIVYRGFYFGMYDTLKPLLLGANASILTSFFLGYGVTLIAGLISYPIDTIRRRMMMRSCEAVKYKGSMDCAIQVIRCEGALSLMKGAGVNIICAWAGASMLLGYNHFKNLYAICRSS